MGTMQWSYTFANFIRFFPPFHMVDFFVGCVSSAIANRHGNWAARPRAVLADITFILMLCHVFLTPLSHYKFSRNSWWPLENHLFAPVIAFWMYASAGGGTGGIVAA